MQIYLESKSIILPPNLLHLTPSDFVLLSHMEKMAYEHEPQDFPEHKAAVTACARTMTAQELRRVLARGRLRARDAKNSPKA